MATDFHLRLEGVLEAAAAAPTGDREALLRRACGDDTRLLRESLSLLPHYVQMRGFEPGRPPAERLGLPGATTLLRLQTEAECGEQAPFEPRPPFNLEQYTIVEIVGRGGMGIVYRAVHPTRNHTVAVKLLRRGLLRAEDRWRFSFEAEILRQLQHPGIARFSHAGLAEIRSRTPGGGRTDERPYIVMEFVAGAPLTRFAAARGLAALERVELMARVCRAIEYAHHRGIVHCDLKPQNILVGESGEPKVLDFGIARLTAFDQDGCRGGVGGTWPYASPEQLRGRIEEITPASDVYALGHIAHELFAGAPAERVGWAVKLRLDAVCVDATRPHADPLNADFRFRLQAILARALRQTRAAPFAQAGELAAALEALFARYARESAWSWLARRWRSRSTPPEGGAADSLGRPLRAVLRRRIGLALDPKATTEEGGGAGEAEDRARGGGGESG